MSKVSWPDRAPSALSLKFGHWLEARATGWGLAALPVVLALALAAWVLVSRSV
jgi:hypothetical protein